jgi:hypothetical protein
MRPPPLRRRPRLHLRWVLLAIAAALCGALVSPHPVVAQGAPPTLPATRAAQRVVGTLDGVSATLRTTRYSHSTHIDPATGRYEWDCSAMAAWVLRRSAPEAARTVPGARPLAVDFYRTIRAAPVARPRGGWTRVARLEDARAGDVLAWPRPRWFPSRNTGHVAFVAEAPQVVSGGVLVRIVDATSLPHEADTRAPDSGGGFGAGYLRVDTDPVTGEGRAYGWYGNATPRAYMIETPVVVGRVWR